MAGRRRPLAITVSVASIGTSIPAVSVIAFVNSYHEHAPAEVRWTRPSAPALDAGDQRLSQISGEGRLQPLVGDHPQLSLRTGAGNHPLDEVAALAGAAVQPVEPGSAHHQRAPAVGERRVLTGELGQRVDRPRRRQIVLAVGLFATPVEHVVGRDVNRYGARSASLRTASTFTCQARSGCCSHTSTL